MSSRAASRLGLRAGDRVIVRSRREILETLDDGGRLDGLLFQPEMFAFCGRRMRVFKSAHKTCDTICKTGGRRMERTVHLEGVRCDGSGHGGCQADCLLFWKEAWLMRDRDAVAVPESPVSNAGSGRGKEDAVASAVHVQVDGIPDSDRWQCQATTLLDASMPLHWWDPRQYWRDVTSGNHSLRHVLTCLSAAAYRRLIGFGHGYRILVSVYNFVQRLRGGRPYWVVSGRIPKSEPTPAEPQNLQAGDWVEIRSLEEIQATLHAGSNFNRGMLFDKEMVPFCGSRQRVRARIERIIDERTGKMIPMKTACIELEGVYCKALYSDRRIGCPRAITPYWREIWLRRS